jgi:drug/metabolite transporter superfamily protein YnfA
MINNEFTHGGSAGKSFVLLLRSLINIAAFAAFWYGIVYWGEPSGRLIAIGGGVLLALCLIWNLYVPIAHR